jgi:hypothetical protein
LWARSAQREEAAGFFHPTKFNTYRFFDHKESMISLLSKVVRVSVETVAIAEAMASLDRSKREA